jgi:AcrR family transcriptional regulator
VAAILEAAGAVIDEKGYEGATMAEIAERSGTKIGSLYRFFPNKESVANTLLEHGCEEMIAAFDRFQAEVRTLSLDAFADGLVALLWEFFGRPGFRKLLDSGKEWLEKREELRISVLRRIEESLMAYNSTLSRESAVDIALVVLLQAKTVATNRGLLSSMSGISDEFRDMNRLYLRSRLGQL